MATVKCTTCNGQYSGYVCKHCGYHFHIPCKKHPDHRTANRCPICNKSW